MRYGRELAVTQRRVEALLAEYEADNNVEGIKEAVGDLAKIRAEGNALNELYNEHVAANQPAPPPRADAWMTKRSDEMNYEDAYNMLNQTSETAKIGGGISREEYIQNIRRLQQEKAAGYHQR